MSLTLMLAASLALTFVFSIGLSLALMLAFSMALAFVFTAGLSLAFMLAFSMALAFVLTTGLALAFVLTTGLALALVLTTGLSLAFVFATGLALAFVFATGLTLAFVFATGLALAFVFATSLALALVFATGMSLAFMSSIIFGTAGGFPLTACRQCGTCSLVGGHIVGIVTQLADFFTQNVGIGLLGIVIDGQLGRFHVVGVCFDSFEIRDIFFETVCTFLAHAIGLDHHRLGGGFLRESAEAKDGHNSQDNRFFHLKLIL